MGINDTKKCECRVTRVTQETMVEDVQRYQESMKDIRNE